MECHARLQFSVTATRQAPYSRFGKREAAPQLLDEDQKRRLEDGEYDFPQFDFLMHIVLASAVAERVRDEASDGVDSAIDFVERKVGGSGVYRPDDDEVLV